MQDNGPVFQRLDVCSGEPLSVGDRQAVQTRLQCQLGDCIVVRALDMQHFVLYADQALSGSAKCVYPYIA